MRSFASLHKQAWADRRPLCINRPGPTGDLFLLGPCVPKEKASQGRGPQADVARRVSTGPGSSHLQSAAGAWAGGFGPCGACHGGSCGRVWTLRRMPWGLMREGSDPAARAMGAYGGGFGPFASSHGGFCGVVRTLRIEPWWLLRGGSDPPDRAMVASAGGLCRFLPQEASKNLQPFAKTCS